MEQQLIKKTEVYIDTLCNRISNRAVGSRGNIDATDFFEQAVSSFGWQVEKDELSAMDWNPGTVSIECGRKKFSALASPYSAGCDVAAELVTIRNLTQLEETDIRGKIILLTGDIAKEQLMPKNFVFYNPEEHKRILSILEREQPSALICATGRNSALAGGAYPFPLIEDGDFNIPGVYMKDIEGEKLSVHSGETVHIISTARRIPSRAYNITARKGSGEKKIIVTAHIDAKKGTPGAIDNATGVSVLLLLAEILSGYDGDHTLEIVALNGEDYYAVPGQMCFIRKNEESFGNICLNINIDGAGYFDGDTAVSFYNTPDQVKRTILNAAEKTPGIDEGRPWPQGDHSIFVQYGVPAVAVTSSWFCENMETQSVTHTPADNPGIVDCGKTAMIAGMLAEAIRQL
jgi:aminopeptidase YwaD